MFDLICFDCDGVLVDSEELSIRVTMDILRENGITLSFQEINTLLTGKSRRASYDAIEHRYGTEVADAYDQEHDRRLFQRIPAELQAIHGVARLLEQLITPVCVTSNSSQERIRFSLSNTRLDHFFGDNILGMEDVAQGKPAPDIFFLAARKFMVSCENCLVIDDSPTGMIAAKAAGAKAAGFCGGGHTGEDHDRKLLAAGADMVFQDMKSLADAITNHYPHTKLP